MTVVIFSVSWYNTILERNISIMVTKDTRNKEQTDIQNICSELYSLQEKIMVPIKRGSG